MRIFFTGANILPSRQCRLCPTVVNTVEKAVKDKPVQLLLEPYRKTSRSCGWRRKISWSSQYNNSMKYTVFILLVASLSAFGMMAVAEKTAPADSRVYGETMSHLILNEQSVFSGLVLETKRGIAITTNRGTFLLKGAEIAGLVGKNVRVTGVIKDGAIFAVKIDS